MSLWSKIFGDISDPLEGLEKVDYWLSEQRHVRSLVSDNRSEMSYYLNVGKKNKAGEEKAELQENRFKLAQASLGAALYETEDDNA